MSSISVLTIGDELVEGRLVDTNSSYISSAINSIGLYVSQHISIGDSMPDIVSTMKNLALSSSAVIVSGGLGPTTDDITAMAAGSAFDKELECFESALNHTKKVFEKINRVMTPNNEKQAWFPKGSSVIFNYRGTACGFSIQTSINDNICSWYFLPGVPHEMKPMLENDVLPKLIKTLAPKPFFVSSFSTFGMGESKIGSLLEDLKPKHGSLKIQYRATVPEVGIRLCIFDIEKEDIATDVLNELSTIVKERLGNVVFAEDGLNLPETLIKLLTVRNETLSIAESCTGGLIAATLANTSGASKILSGSFVCYSNYAKETMLGIDKELIESHGAVSEEVAIKMATSAKEILKTTYAISVTGIAGPTGGTIDKPVGTVFIALASPNAVISKKLSLGGDRDRVRRYSAYSAMDLLRKSIC